MPQKTASAAAMNEIPVKPSQSQVSNEYDHAPI